jgi:very-short-patch-repair endonuclease
LNYKLLYGKGNEMKRYDVQDETDVDVAAEPTAIYNITVAKQLFSIIETYIRKTKGECRLFFAPFDVLPATFFNLTPDPSPKERGVGQDYVVCDLSKLNDAECLETTGLPAAPLSFGEGSGVRSKGAETRLKEVREEVEPGYYTSEKSIWLSTLAKAKEGRKNPTDAENLLWENLRNRKIDGYKFRRQHAIEGFIPDFLCLEKKLIIEVDGGYHNEKKQQEYDKQRTEFLENIGYKIIRFTNEDVLNNCVEVLNKIRQHLELSSKEKKDLTELSPDLVIEVLSPSTESHDTDTKFNIYRIAGVREYWIVDVKKNSITVFQLQSDGNYDVGTIYNSGDKVTSSILPGFKLDLQQLFFEL